MLILVSNEGDIASMNIRGRLLELGGFAEAGAWEGRPVHTRPGMTMVLIGGTESIRAEGLDARLRDGLAIEFDSMVFLSRHASASNNRSLTVHHVGCFGPAAHGGREGRLSPSSPRAATHALRSLMAVHCGKDFSVSFEATHHGPYLETPAFFIEIGSDEEAWRDRAAAEAVARAVLSLDDPSWRTLPVLVGVGGGHYAPRHTDVARRRAVAFGHIAAGYAVEFGVERVLEAARRTPDASGVYFHRRALSDEMYVKLRDAFASSGVPEAAEESLPPLSP